MKNKNIYISVALALFMIGLTEVPIFFFDASVWWRLCDFIAVALAARFYFIADEEWIIKAFASLIVYSFFMIYALPIILPIVLVIYGQHKWEQIRVHNEIRKEKKEIKQKLKKLGAKPNARYLSWRKMCGVGNLTCQDCGYVKKEILSFTHGIHTCSCGRQCPECGTFLEERFYGDQYGSHSQSDEFICPECGTVVREKNKNYNDDAPLFCPKCKSVNLHYEPLYLT